MKRILATVIGLAFIGMLGACNTVEGAGKDVEKAGEKVQDASQDVKKKM